LIAMGLTFMGAAIDDLSEPVATRISELQLAVKCNNMWSLASFETTYYRVVNGHTVYDYMSKGYAGSRTNFIQDAIVFAINNGYW